MAVFFKVGFGLLQLGLQLIGSAQSHRQGAETSYAKFQVAARRLKRKRLRSGSKVGTHDVNVGLYIPSGNLT